MNALIALQPKLSVSDWLADLAVDALIDEADLSPKPGLVDQRGSGAHTDLHLGLMHASALALWPSFKAMAEAAQQRGEIGLQLREELGRIGREGEEEMLRVTGGVNTHRGAIWALGLLSAAAALDVSMLAPAQVALRAARLAEATLMRGFTTVRDMGGPTLGLKRAIDEGLMKGPRIYPSGAFISQTSGHGDFRFAFEVPRKTGGPLSYSEREGIAAIADSNAHSSASDALSPSTTPYVCSNTIVAESESGWCWE